VRLWYVAVMYRYYSGAAGAPKTLAPGQWSRFTRGAKAVFMDLLAKQFLCAVEE
jgi:hypothetical protein